MCLCVYVRERERERETATKIKWHRANARVCTDQQIHDFREHRLEIAISNSYPLCPLPRVFAPILFPPSSIATLR